MVTFVPQVSLQKHFQFLFLNVLVFFIKETNSFKTVMPLSSSFRKTSNKSGYSCQRYCCFIAIQLIKNICSLANTYTEAHLNLSVVSRVAFDKNQQILIFALNEILHCFVIFIDKSQYLRIDTSYVRRKTVTQNISPNITIFDLIGSNPQLKLLNIIYFSIQRIEAFWSQLRRSNMQFWMNYFKVSQFE